MNIACKKQIEQKYKTAIGKIKKAQGSPDELVEVMLGLYHKDDMCVKGYASLLAAYYLLEGQFETAWALANYMRVQWEAPRSCIEDIKDTLISARNLEAPWPAWRCDQKARLQGHIPAAFSDNNKTINNKIFERARRPKETVLIDLSPERRLDKVDGTRKYYVSYDCFLENLHLLELAQRQERLPESEECLTRLKITLESGEPPRHLLEFPRIKQLAPWVAMLECRQAARQAKPAETRRELATAALEHALLAGLATIGTRYYDWFFDFFVCCEIIGEFELLEDRHSEFLHYFAPFSKQASISYSRALTKLNPSLFVYEDHGWPDLLEFKARHDRKYPPTDLTLIMAEYLKYFGAYRDRKRGFYVAWPGEEPAEDVEILTPENIFVIAEVLTHQVDKLTEVDSSDTQLERREAFFSFLDEECCEGERLFKEFCDRVCEENKLIPLGQEYFMGGRYAPDPDFEDFAPLVRRFLGGLLLRDSLYERGQMHRARQALFWANSPIYRITLHYTGSYSTDTPQGQAMSALYFDVDSHYRDLDRGFDEEKRNEKGPFRFAYRPSREVK